MELNQASISLRVVNQIPAMVAYWDKDQCCVFSNDAYTVWFGKSPKEMFGMKIETLLGSLYEKNLPHIREALKGNKQIFERQIPLPTGEIREAIATYTPDVIDGAVEGFSVHVADITLLRKREAALNLMIRERDEALADARTLRGLLPICAGCKSIRDADNNWQTIEKYVAQRTDVTFTHGLCPRCVAKYYPEMNFPAG